MNHLENNVLQKETQEYLETLLGNLRKEYTYHNIYHTQEVVENVLKLAEQMRIVCEKN